MGLDAINPYFLSLPLPRKSRNTTTLSANVTQMALRNLRSHVVAWYICDVGAKKGGTCTAHRQRPHSSSSRLSGGRCLSRNLLRDRYGTSTANKSPYLRVLWSIYGFAVCHPTTITLTAGRSLHSTAITNTEGHGSNGIRRRKSDVIICSFIFGAKRQSATDVETDFGFRTR